MGYSLESKAYRLYSPFTKQIIISRDVEFLENESWDGSVDASFSTSSKVPIIDEDDELDDQQHEATIEIEGSRKLRIALIEIG